MASATLPAGKSAKRVFALETRGSIFFVRRDLPEEMDCRVTGERSDSVLRTAMPGNDA